MGYEVISYIDKNPVVVQTYKREGWAYKAFEKREASGVYDCVEFRIINDDGTKELMFWSEPKRKEN